MFCEAETDKFGMEITRAVYDVSRLFLESGFPDFTVCEKNVVNVEPGEVVVYQLNGESELSPRALRVGYVQSMTVSPVSGKTSFYCNLFSVSNVAKCFKATGRTYVRVTYEQMRVKLVDTIVRDGIGVYLKNFHLLPALVYFE